MKTGAEVERGPRQGVIKCGTDRLRLIGSAVTPGPRERLGVLTPPGVESSQADTVIGGELGASCVAQQQCQCLLPPGPSGGGAVCRCWAAEGPGTPDKGA